MEIRDTFFGPKNVIFHESSLEESPFKSKKIVEIRTHTFICENASRKTMSIKYEFKNQGITNFKISPASSLDLVELEIGGLTFSKYELFKNLKCEVKSSLICDNVFPLLKTHDIRINFETNQTSIITVSYDIVDLTINMDNKRMYSVLTKSEQNAGPYTFNDNTINSISLNSVNRPIRYIYAFLPDDVEDARLIIDNEDYDLVLTYKDNCYFYYFGENICLNVSSINDIRIVVKTKTAHLNFDANVYVICKELIILNNEMANIVFKG